MLCEIRIPMKIGRVLLDTPDRSRTFGPGGGPLLRLSTYGQKVLGIDEGGLSLYATHDAAIQEFLKREHWGDDWARFYADMVDWLGGQLP